MTKAYLPVNKSSVDQSELLVLMVESFWLYIRSVDFKHTMSNELIDSLERLEKEIYILTSLLEDEYDHY
jgi:hypothetical protein